MEVAHESKNVEIGYLSKWLMTLLKDIDTKIPLVSTVECD